MMCSGMVRNVKVGDKIILGKHRLINGHREVWNKQQEELIGKVATIRSTTTYQGRRYVMVKENPYHWLLLDATLTNK